MPLVLMESSDGVVTITLNRPEAHNALSLDLIVELGTAVESVATDPDLRVVVLAGAGKSFCAGMDLKAVRDDPVAMGEMLRRLSQATRQLRRLPVPVIARVQGAAIGGGCGLMVVADFAVTHPEAKVGYPEVDLGICPAVVAPWLVRRIGAGPARAMLLAGGTMTGAEGHARGLATHLAELDRLDDAVQSLVRRLVAGGPKALAATKKWMNDLDGSCDDAVLDRAAEISAAVIAGTEAQGRLAARFASA
ncbi:MAG: enoyl-CoA hydratase/isomerase family protein [Phycisphaerales bacterium]|nr:enoyl-CoA hydratase/isomerase family protein [Phycisphaerales bacterium]